MPSLFLYLRSEALEHCREKEESIFGSSPPFDQFISTGDGGFQPFATPLQAVVFAIHFETYLAAFNSSFHFPRLRAFVEQPVVVRYALTFDKVFEQDGNIFGPGIISNSRIISRDTLNRFLIDEKTVGWFQQHLASVESLLTLRSEDLSAVSQHGRSHKRPPRSSLFGSTEPELGVKAVHLQKIGILTAKNKPLDVFSLMIQVAVPLAAETGASKRRTAVVTVGNLNTGGIAA
jgi:hypothetical protein